MIRYIVIILIALLQSCSKQTTQNNDLSIAEMEFKYIVPGSFTMGKDIGNADQQPSRKIKITKSYWMAKYECTQKMWKKYMGRTIIDQRNKVNKDWSLRGQGDQIPIYYVSWNECQELIKILNAKYADKLPENYKFGLPTEAQWEYACSAGYPKPQGDLALSVWFDGNADQHAHPVGQKQPNAWGLHDMYGNVWEWCSDFYDEYNEKDLIDPQGPTKGTVRVSRGASWHEGAGDCYAAKRDWYSQDGSLYNLGFRLAIIPKQ